MAGESNSVIDLMFLCYRSLELDHHSILPESRLFLDHAPFLIDITISEEIIQMSKFTLAPKSDQETTFIQNIVLNFKCLDISNIEDINKLKQIVNQLGIIIDQAWTKNTKKSKISKHSKQWWSEEYKQSFENYRASRSLENWKKFKKTVKNVKRSYFDDKIQEITNKSRGLWELMNWIKRRKLPAIEAINYDSQLCLTLNSLWNALHKSFNSALNCQVNLNIFNKIEHKPSQ